MKIETEFEAEFWKECVTSVLPTLYTEFGHGTTPFEHIAADAALLADELLQQLRERIDK